MSALAAIEASFQQYVLHGADAIDSNINGRDRDFRAERLRIYFDAYRSRLAEVLGNDYPVLKAYVGDDIFAHVAQTYVAQHASTHRNVRWFGQHLPQHLGAATEIQHRDTLAELAQFEWSLGLAFDAKDAAPVQFDDLAQLPADAWSTLRFETHPCLVLCEFETNAVAIWQALRTEAAGVAPTRLAQAQSVAVWRADFTSYFRTLEVDEAWAVNALARGATFTELCEELSQWNTEPAARAAALLRGWIDNGWLRKEGA
jgi:hypothetical protein